MVDTLQKSPNQSPVLPSVDLVGDYLSEVLGLLEKKLDSEPNLKSTTEAKLISLSLDLRNENKVISKQDFIDGIRALAEAPGMSAASSQVLQEFASSLDSVIVKIQPLNETEWNDSLLAYRAKIKREKERIALANRVVEKSQAEVLNRLKMNTQQQTLLAQKNINVSSLIARIKMETSPSARGKTFRVRLYNSLLPQLESFYKHRKKIVDDIKGSMEPKKVAEDIANLKPKAVGKETGLYKFAIKLSEKRTQTQNILSLYGIKPITEYPLLKIIFPGGAPDNLLKGNIDMDVVKSTLDKKIEALFPDEIFTDVFVKGLSEGFRDLEDFENMKLKLQEKDAVKLERAKADMKIVKSLMETIPQAHQEKKWGKAYEKYVLKTGVLALNFESWYGAQEVSFMDKLRYDILGPMLSFFSKTWKDLKNIGKEDIEDEDSLPSQVDKYEEALKAIPKPGGNSALDNKKNLSSKAIETEKHSEYKKLKKAFEQAAEQQGDSLENTDINLVYEGASLSQLETMPENIDFSNITQMLNRYSESYKLLIGPFDYDSVDFVAKYSRNNSDNLHFTFEDGGFKFSYDLGAYKGLNDDFDEEGEIAGAVAGGAVGGKIGFGGGPISWVTVPLGIIVGAGLGAASASMAENRISIPSSYYFKFDSLSPEYLESRILEIRKKTKIFQKYDTRNLEKYSDGGQKYDKYLSDTKLELPSKLLSGSGFCPAMLSLFKYMDKKGDERKLDTRKLKLLEMYFEDKGGYDEVGGLSFQFYQIGSSSPLYSNVYMEDEEEISISDLPKDESDNKKVSNISSIGNLEFEKLSQGFLHIDGSGEYFGLGPCDNFENLEAFFNYIEKGYQKSWMTTPLF